MKSNSRLIYLLAIVKMVLPYLLQNQYYEPHRDEFLYLAEGQHLAWGYMEVPPLLSVFAWLTHAFGNSIFWIKFWPNLFGAFTFILCARIADKLNGDRLAIWLVFFPFIFGAWLRMFFLFQANAPEILFCTWMAYAIFRYIQTGESKWFYIFGIALGLGMMSKYSVAFWAISLFMGLLLTRHRLVFGNKHFYMAMLLAFFIMAPNLLWQMVHHFPVMQHMKELRETQLQYVGIGDFMAGQFLMYLPVFFIWIAGLLYCFSFKGRHFRLFGFAFLTMQILLMLFHGKSYYTAGAFPVLFALGSVAVEGFVRQNAKFVRFAVIAFPVVTGILLWPLLLPVFKPEKLADFYRTFHFERTGALRWGDLESHELPQDFADMLGWKELAAKTSKAWNSFTPEEKKHSIIWTGNYGEAGALNYYRTEFKLPEAHSENASFIFWYHDTTFPRNIILIEHDHKILTDPILAQFQTVQVMDSITNNLAIVRGTLIIKLQNPTEAFQRYFSGRMEAKRRALGGR